MANDLFTNDGKRKYLTSVELDKFIACANGQIRAKVRTFCLVLAYTGCRISEALALTADSIDLSEKTIILRTLKQRGKVKYRAIPVPEHTLDALELVHRIRRSQRAQKKAQPLWSWGRTQAYKHIKAVMKQSDIQGVHATPKGLRHGFGVRAADKTRNPRLVQKWLGHSNLETTIIYIDVIGQQERDAAMNMWG